MTYKPQQQLLIGLKGQTQLYNFLVTVDNFLSSLGVTGLSQTVNLAKLTNTGTQGSITFTNGIATNIVDPT